MRSPAMHGESFILNDEDEKVYAGVRSQVAGARKTVTVKFE